MSEATLLDDEGHRRVAVAQFNRTWELLDKAERTAEEDAEMLTAAFTSRYHWRQIGKAENFTVSDWQISRVAAVLGLPDLAERYGRSSLEAASMANLGPFFIGYGHEALARAARLAGNRDDAARHLSAAQELLEQITDPKERNLLAPDLEELGAP
jgi:hypothetical protein